MMAAPDVARAVLQQAAVSYRSAGVTAALSNVAFAPLPALSAVAAVAPPTAPPTPRVPGAQPSAGDTWAQAQAFLQQQYGPLKAWQWAAVAGGGILVVSMAYKLAKYALLGGALAGGALLVSKVGGMKLSGAGG